MPIQTACPELTEADNKRRMEGMDLLYSHGDGEVMSLQLYQELSFLFFYILFSRSTS